MTTDAPTLPHSPEAEASVIGQMLAQPQVVGEVVGTLLEPQHFYVPAFRALYHTIVESYYADDPIDALTIATLSAKTLARAWDCDESQAVAQVQSLTLGQGAFAGDAADHARLVKRDSDYRALLDLSVSIQRAVELERDAPDVVAGEAATNAMRIATDTLLTHEILSFDQLKDVFLEEQRFMAAARAAGIDVGAYFGLPFLDDHLRGLRGTELFILAGDPGSGKSAVAWEMARRFAERQMRKDKDKRVGAFVLSLEMGKEPSTGRIAQAIAGLDGGAVREGKLAEEDLRKVAAEWTRRAGLPLHFNFTSTLRASQLRALIVESIRRHNTGLVVIDHMRYFDMDGKYQFKVEEEEDKARFLKQSLAKDLNVAVVCLAHTTKDSSNTEDKRPRMRHLRGSGQISAEADFLGFVYRPYDHATPDEKAAALYARADAELIWEKARHARKTTAQFTFDAARMDIH